MDDKRGMDAAEDEELEESENIIINEVDGLPNLHPNYQQLEFELDTKGRDDINTRTIEDLVHDEDLPMSVIVTNVDPRVFKNDELKSAIENLFKQFGEDATFQYFRSFRRMRVNYNSPSAAANARIQLHQTHFGETDINCYFAQPVTPIDMEDQHLQPPALTKQFLISPPASPPIGWEPREEGEPLVNHDLLAAIANLSAGGTHELHPGGSGQPGIVVHVCETTNPIKNAPRIQHTRCPEHSCDFVISCLGCVAFENSSNSVSAYYQTFCELAKLEVEVAKLHGIETLQQCNVEHSVFQELIESK